MDGWMDGLVCFTSSICTFIQLLFSSIKDRKSTRLNSSHPSISYAVFCLKKKNANLGYHVSVEDANGRAAPWSMVLRVVRRSNELRDESPKFTGPDSSRLLTDVHHPHRL